KLLEIKHTLRDSHEHIVETFGAYRHGEGATERVFIAFPWGDGTLAKYLAGLMPTLSSECLWKQMSGIDDGLAALHRQHDNATRHTRSGLANLAADGGSEMVRFYHLDLKPANILV